MVDLPEAAPSGGSAPGRSTGLTPALPPLDEMIRHRWSMAPQHPPTGTMHRKLRRVHRDGGCVMRRQALVVGVEGPAADPADDSPPVATTDLCGSVRATGG